MTWEPRLYRQRHAPSGLSGFQVTIGETDLYIAARGDRVRLKKAALEAAARARTEIESWLERDPVFGESFVPHAVPGSAPEIVRKMAAAAEAAGVGPMAAVAGAVSDRVAEALRPLSDELIVENGGDIVLSTGEDRIVGIDAGPSPLSGRIGLLVPASGQPVGVCTSSATVGPSISLGRADAAVVACRTAAAADAYASRIGNMVHGPDDLEKAADYVAGESEIISSVVIVGERMILSGSLEVVPLWRN